ncbi:hypothetical protein [Asticcacaulis sp. AND118]|uniref:hypothetical protein n=1 Tax=Asticcacaulis sp. AND118 TaxID=2840468 RepID=UPI001CFF87C3|nr:hypothetical protein [Asticcacaulis sp. AND118]UDF02987.1 hypothetical protein LH365_11160 [Asticcacaulis sp. AND118]
MSDSIKYFGTETVHGHDGQPLPADTPIRVEFKGGDLHADIKAGVIGHLDHRPNVGLPDQLYPPRIRRRVRALRPPEPAGRHLHR